MRLIDADAIIDYLNKRKEVLAQTYGVNNEYVKCIGEIVNIIEMQTEIKIESKI